MKPWQAWIIRALVVGSITAAGVTIGVVACAADPSGGQGHMKPIEVQLPDGRSVVCVYGDPGRAAAVLSCDWEHAR
jgi:hypothetical protein